MTNIMKRELVNAIDSMLTDGRHTELLTVFKNGKPTEAFVIRKDGDCASPTFYFKDFEKTISSGMPVKRIAEDILAACDTARVPQIRPNDFTDYEKQKDKISFKVVNTTQYKEQLDEIPSVQVNDLSIIFQIVLENSANGTATATVTNNLLDCWKISVDELYRTALTNTQKMMPLKFAPMGEILSEMCSDDLRSIDFSVPQLYVATNRTSLNGFSTIFYPRFLDTLAAKFGRFYILPSSLHEALIVPEELGTDEESLYQMVCEINRTQVSPADRLTDNVYWYDAVAKQLMAYV